MKRKRDRDEWLWDRIDEDLTAMADEREKLLMESEELQNVKVPEGMLENIHRELEIRNGTARKVRIRRRMVIAVAAAAVSCVGFGVIGYGNREYEPEIIEYEGKDGLKIENTDSIYSEYDEEEVCKEIQETLGVIPVRLCYQPQGMYLENYWIEEKPKEVILKYSVDEEHVYIYISKDYKESSVNYETDGEELDTLIIDSTRLEIKVFKYEYENEDSLKQSYYISSFKYLNTYYSIHGMIEYDEFIKILENIAIENV